MTIAQKLIDIIHGKSKHKHDPIELAHLMAKTHNADDSFYLHHKDNIFAFTFNDASTATLVPGFAVWIGEAH